MRVWWFSLVVACEAPPTDIPEPAGPCREVWNRLEADDRSWWGTGASGLRVAAGGPSSASRADGAPIRAELAWPAGPAWMVWAEADDLPVPASPLACADRVELPARLALYAGEVPVEVSGVYRAVGPYVALSEAFVGRVGAAPGWAEAAAGGELAVWASWGEAGFSGEIREVPPGADDAEAGAPLTTWGP